MPFSTSRSTAVAPSMPPELVETILNFISHRPTLRACSLAGPAFTLTAQRGLFSEVVLSPPKSRSQRHTPAHRLLDVITSSPHLASFVHSLMIECEDSADGQPWLYSDTDLQHIFPILNSLTKISVNGRIQPGDDERISGKANLSWTSLSSTLRSALVSIIRSGSVIDLELGGFNHIPVSSVIHLCSRLKKLSLLPLYLVDDSPAEAQAQVDVVPPETRVHLEDIKIKQSAIALRRTADWLLSPTCYLDVGELKRFNFQVSTLEDHHQISRIVEACSKSLERLELNPGSEVNSIRVLHRKVPIERSLPHFSLESLKALKSLKIKTSILTFKLNNNRFSDPLPWLVSLLSTLPDENDLSELELCFALQLTQEVLQQVSWSDLSTVLQSRKFSALKDITFTFPSSKSSTIPGVNDRLFWARDVLRQNEHLSPLANRGLLHLAA